MAGTSHSTAHVPLTSSLRRLTRGATLVAALTSPSVFLTLHRHYHWSIAVSLVATVLSVVAFRGLVDVVMRRLIPWPNTFGAEDKLLQEEITARRRVWFWGRKYHWLATVAVSLGAVLLGLTTIVFLVLLFTGKAHGWTDAIHPSLRIVTTVLPQFLLQALPLALTLPLFFLANLLMMFGPLLFFGMMQIRGYEPGDAQWGVKLDDVRGQAEAKEEVRRIVSLWQSSDEFIAAGGKPDRGLLFLGKPGTGKTFLAKAIASSFACPFVAIPGSGFASTFIGVDVILVRYLAWKAKKLARKWGGKCIIFIDEIDAVGMRRAALGMDIAPLPLVPASIEDLGAFHGQWGALNPSGDLVLETRQWRDRLFDVRAERDVSGFATAIARVNGAFNFMMPGMGGMGSMALNQLLIVMDGMGGAPIGRRLATSKINTLLDASYFVPQKIGSLKLRLPPAKPAPEQIYFIGATNVPLEQLDPALVRPGRMGRHVWFRTPNFKDRVDILDLYLGKIAHEDELDTPERRQEVARITNGYSPASIQQVCSLALTYAQHDGRPKATWADLTEAMVALESGMADPVDYSDEETRAVATHEAGHAAAAHVYMPNTESTRLSIRKRGGSLGHHQALDKEERFSTFRAEEFARLIWGLGAMAAERIFYGENSTGVGGDVQMVTSRAAWMVGSCAMAPEPVPTPGAMERFEQIGAQIVARSGGGGMMGMDPVSAVLSDPAKRRIVAQLVGQAYVAAYQLIKANQDGIKRIADVLIAKKEIFGDELIALLDGAEIRVPENVDLKDDCWWPHETIDLTARTAGWVKEAA
ncbi:MAG: cell division protease FtsH [Gaiellaceae bacterium]|nr:cell division protease FtsH [Gaiellaceae bacterium]